MRRSVLSRHSSRQAHATAGRSHHRRTNIGCTMPRRPILSLLALHDHRQPIDGTLRGGARLRSLHGRTVHRAGADGSTRRHRKRRRRTVCAPRLTPVRKRTVAGLLRTLLLRAWLRLRATERRGEAGNRLGAGSSTSRTAGVHPVSARVVALLGSALALCLHLLPRRAHRGVERHLHVPTWLRLNQSVTSMSVMVPVSAENV